MNRNQLAQRRQRAVSGDFAPGISRQNMTKTCRLALNSRRACQRRHVAGARAGVEVAALLRVTHAHPDGNTSSENGTRRGTARRGPRRQITSAARLAPGLWPTGRHRLAPRRHRRSPRPTTRRPAAGLHKSQSFSQRRGGSDLPLTAQTHLGGVSPCGSNLEIQIAPRQSKGTRVQSFGFSFCCSIQGRHRSLKCRTRPSHANEQG